MRRRTFISTSVTSAAVALASCSKNAYAVRRTSPMKELPRRPYGNTGEYLSILGFGGVVVRGIEQNEADRAVRKAIDAGVNYFDVAPTYGDAELRLGPALKEFRNDVFLACKSTQRTAESITKELHQSLKNLRTDHFDLYQLHSLTTAKDIKTAFGDDSALEAVLRAKEKGLVRYVGFSAHSVEAAMEALEYYDFDSMLVPINFVMWNRGNFGPQLIEYARSKGTAVLALKSMALTRLKEGEERPFPGIWYRPVANVEEAVKALSFTLSLPVTAAIPPGYGELFWTALKAAPDIFPLSEEEKDELKLKSKNYEPIFRYPSGSFNLVSE